MPRRARLNISGYPLHVIQRGNNKAACFFADHDRCVYLGMLEELAALYECAIHAYVLMTNHVHVLATPSRPRAISRLMQNLGQRYVQYVNRTHKRTGGLWEGRFKSCVIDSERYLLTCSRYIELNPVRAGMVGHPELYAWSSYRANANGEISTLLSPHPLYMGLGADADDRRKNYRAFFREVMPSTVLDQIRAAANGGFALGSEDFIARIERASGMKARPGRPGRPRKGAPTPAKVLPFGKRALTPV